MKTHVSPLIVLLAVMAIAGHVYGQAFDVVSVRESDPTVARAGIRGTIQSSPGNVTVRNTTLRDAIEWAYDEPGARIRVVGGPKWVDTVHYEIAARAAAASSDTQLRLMLRAVLADRFKLVVRAEKRASAVYYLTLDPKGHKLSRSTTTGPRRVQPDATGVAFQNVTMTDLQQFLLQIPGLDRPVINRTGLEGRFDFKLAVLTTQDTDDARKAGVASANFPYFANALREVGLKLEPGQVPLDVITIEQAEPPAEN